MSDEVVEHVKLAEEEDGVSEKEREVRLQCRESFREDEVIDDENGCVVKHQDEVIGQLIQEIAVIDLNEQERRLGKQCQEIGSPICSSGEGKCEETEEQLAKVTEQQLQHGERSREIVLVKNDSFGKVSQEPIQDEQHSVLIDKEDGLFVKQNEQQDFVNEEEIQEQMQLTALNVEVENKLHSREEQHTRVIVGENVCPGELHGEVMEPQVQNQKQEIAVVIEEQNIVEENDRVTDEQSEVIEQGLPYGKQSQESVQEEQHSLVIEYKDGSSGQQVAQQDLVTTFEVTEQQRENKRKNQVLIQEVQKYKVREAQVQVTEQQRGHEQKSREPIEEQPGKMAEDENGSPNEQQGEVNKGHLLIQCQGFIVENQNVSGEKYQVTGEQVIVTKQEKDHGQQNQEQKDEVKGQKNQSVIQVTTETVDNHNVAEPTDEVTEEQVEIAKQQRHHGQQIQEEQNCKVNNCQDGYPKQQNEQLDGVDGDQVHNQMQDIEVSVEKHIDAKLKYKAPEDQIEEQCHSTQQQCGTEEHIECIKRQIQFHEEVVEGIDELTRPEALQVQNVSELQEQLELLQKLLNAGMQESFSRNQEKAAARTVDSTPPLTSQKLSYHSSSTFYRENCLKLLKMTHKLQEKTLEVQERLLDLLTPRELSHTFSKDFIYSEGRTMPIAGSCGEREYIDCGFPAQMKKGHLRQQISLGKTTATASESDCRLMKEPNCQEQRQRDPEQEKSKKFDSEAVESSGQPQQQPAQDRQLRSQRQRQSKSESLLTTSVELSPRRDQDTQLLTTRVTEKPQKLKRSSEKTGQTQLLHWRLRPRGKIMSESIQATSSIARYMEGSSPSKSVYHEQHQVISSTARSQVKKPGITATSQMKKQQANHCNRQKRGTPEPTTLSNAIGPILPCKKPALSCQKVELPTPEACEEGPIIMDKSSQPVVRNEDHHDREKIMKSKPTTMAETPQLNSDLPLTAKELQQKQLCHMSLRSRSHAASQSELVVSMAKSLPLEHHSEKPQEMKHQGIWRPKLNALNQHNGERQPPNKPEQPRKPRGRPAKRKLDVAATEDVSLPAKYQKLQEEPKNQRQERAPDELMSFSPLKHPEQPQKRSGRPRKWNPDNDLVKNYHTQRNLRSNKREQELQLPKQSEQQRKPRGRPAKRKLDMAATEDVSLPSKYKLQEEPRNQKQKKERSPNAHHEELQLLKHPEQPQKRRGRPKKLSPDDELVENCHTQRNLRSHKREEEPQLPKKPEQPQNSKKQRGRPSKLISANKLKQNKSHSIRRQSKRLKEQREATIATELEKTIKGLTSAVLVV